MNIYFDDLRQSGVVMWNELFKFFRGKKMLLYMLLLVGVIVLITVAPYLFGGGLSNDSRTIYVNYMLVVKILILLSATLFASTVIVSEYEERTALLLFTRPIKKRIIFLGKFMAAMITGVFFIMIYYIAIVLISVLATGSVDGGLLSSFGLAIVYTFSVTGVAMLVSSLAKKGSTAAIMTFVVVLLMLPLVSMVLPSSIDTWWMLNDASSSVTEVLQGVRDSIDQVMMAILDFFKIDKVPEFLTQFMTPAPQVLRDAAVMLLWGAGTSVASYAVFKRREF